jgi:hypothetical protein
LTQLATLAVEDDPAETMAAFPTIELHEGAAAHGFIVEVAQNVHCLVDATDLGDGLREARGVLADLQSTHDAGGPDATELQGSDEESGPFRVLRRHANRIGVRSKLRVPPLEVPAQLLIEHAGPDLQ